MMTMSAKNFDRFVPGNDQRDVLIGLVWQFIVSSSSCVCLMHIRHMMKGLY